MKRISGHTLISEAIPRFASKNCNTQHQACLKWSERGDEVDGSWYGRIHNEDGSVGNDGHARCSCGAESPHLPSQGKRKAWHRAHKAEVLAKLAGGPEPEPEG